MLINFTSPQDKAKLFRDFNKNFLTFYHSLNAVSRLIYLEKMSAFIFLCREAGKIKYVDRTTLKTQLNGNVRDSSRKEERIWSFGEIL